MMKDNVKQETCSNKEAGSKCMTPYSLKIKQYLILICSQPVNKSESKCERNCVSTENGTAMKAMQINNTLHRGFA